MLRKVLSVVAIASGLAAPAHALTVGEFRNAYATLHALDPIPQNKRDAYIKTHRSEIDIARTRLEASVMVRDTILGTNGLLVQQGQRPFLCNYDLEDADDDMDLNGWVEEFRSEAMERNKLVAGPKTDALIDAVQFEEVLNHKLMEKYPCPASMPLPPPALLQQGQTATSAHVHAH